LARREGGIRLYAAREATPPPEDAGAVHDALVDVVVAKYAPLPLATLGMLVSRLSIGVPQWTGERSAVLKRTKARLAHERIAGVDWYWPAGERIRRAEPEERVRLLAPFDPLVWDRRRFELFWGWAYRFEAYTPAPKRQLGYYALPLLWRDQVIGWGNLAWRDGRLAAQFGYVAGRAPRDRAFRNALDAEIAGTATFLGDA
jgi:uncharacterized protein